MSGARAKPVPEMARELVAGTPFPLLGGTPLALRAAIERLLSWQERARQRRHLSRLEGHMLEDIGLTRAEMAREIEKPFWRP